MEEFKAKPLEWRSSLSEKIIADSNGSKFPLMVQRLRTTRGKNDWIEGNKWLVNGEWTVGQFLEYWKGEAKVDIGLDLQVNGKVLGAKLKVKDVWREFRDDDGFVYARLEEVDIVVVMLGRAMVFGAILATGLLGNLVWSKIYG